MIEINFLLLHIILTSFNSDTLPEENEKQKLYKLILYTY